MIKSIWKHLKENKIYILLLFLSFLLLTNLETPGIDSIIENLILTLILTLFSTILIVFISWYCVDKD